MANIERRLGDLESEVGKSAEGISCKVHLQWEGPARWECVNAKGEPVVPTWQQKREIFADAEIVVNWD